MDQYRENYHSVRQLQAVMPPPVKHVFPFRLGTTSYIIPDAIIPNLRFLGPYVDEVELVLFESGNECNLPSPGEIVEMKRLGREFDLTFNIHLPADVFLADPDPLSRERYCETILRFYQRMLSLEPVIFILHLDSRSADGRKTKDWASWSGRIWESLEKLLAEGVDPRLVALENLEYPVEIFLPCLKSFGMSLCLDIGHLLRYGYDLAHHLERYGELCSMIHLHGVKEGIDHVGLQWIPEKSWRTICESLRNYRRGVSIEVFSVEDLIASLNRVRHGVLQTLEMNPEVEWTGLRLEGRIS